MNFLRSSFLVAIVSLFVLVGYGSELLGYCCQNSKSTRVDCGPEVSLGGQVPADDDACHCVCHEMTPSILFEPVPATDRTLEASDFLMIGDQFPPDAVPLGIEYPPQLA